MYFHRSRGELATTIIIGEQSINAQVMIRVESRAEASEDGQEKEEKGEETNEIYVTAGRVRSGRVRSTIFDFLFL